MVHDNLLKALSSYGVPPAGVVSEADMKTWSDKSPKEIDDLLLHLTQRNSNLYYTAKNSALYRHALDRQVDSEVVGFPSAGLFYWMIYGFLYRLKRFFFQYNR